MSTRIEPFHIPGPLRNAPALALEVDSQHVRKLHRLVASVEAPPAAESAGPREVGFPAEFTVVPQPALEPLLIFAQGPEPLDTR
jgi:hypothetical protein